MNLVILPKDIYFSFLSKLPHLLCSDCQELYQSLQAAIDNAVQKGEFSVDASLSKQVINLYSVRTYTHLF